VACAVQQYVAELTLPVSLVSAISPSPLFPAFCPMVVSTFLSAPFVA
jgi:hypothetical protein